ncbi:TetR/AcrR family transcriptional regulator [Pseudonocardia eucalypti]|uniref:TetR/AcrR family transcriptional regulator n=1 Tax=Pseudonocardia eucalypti TaxID=648755 RepID=A0ABP9QKM1_9PSEU|nr:AcrR family transcriptional regulator [Pseudonocardia eucalypti]
MPILTGSGSTSAREKLLDTASALFYRRGIVATGVDTVVEASGVSKPTLYAHFRSKSELIAAVLDRRHTRRVVALPAWLGEAADDPLERLLALFDWLAEIYARDAPRGCAFLNAAAETPDADQPAWEVISRHKRWMTDFLTELATNAGLTNPAQLGSQLLLLIDGASSRVLVEAGAHPPADRITEIVAHAKQAAKVLITHAGRLEPTGPLDHES